MNRWSWNTESKLMKLTKVYTVWVGGTEVNDYLLSLADAEKVKQEYNNDGYDDVIIEKVLNQN